MVDFDTFTDVMDDRSDPRLTFGTTVAPQNEPPPSTANQKEWTAKQEAEQKITIEPTDTVPALWAPVLHNDTVPALWSPVLHMPKQPDHGKGAASLVLLS